MTDQTLALVRRQCTAMSKGSRERCKRAPMWGSNVCSKHGARAPQVKRKAEERIREMLDPALNNLRRAMDSEDMGAVVRACLAVLALNGHTPETMSDARAAAARADAAYLKWMPSDQLSQIVSWTKQINVWTDDAKRRMAAGEGPARSAQDARTPDVVEGYVLLPEGEESEKGVAP